MGENERIRRDGLSKERMFSRCEEKTNGEITPICRPLCSIQKHSKNIIFIEKSDDCGFRFEGKEENWWGLLHCRVTVLPLTLEERREDQMEISPTHIIIEWMGKRESHCSTLRRMRSWSLLRYVFLLREFHDLECSSSLYSHSLRSHVFLISLELLSLIQKIRRISPIRVY